MVTSMSRGVIIGLSILLVLFILTVLGVRMFSSTNMADEKMPQHTPRETASGLPCADGYDDILAQALEAKDVEYCTCEDSEYAAELCTIAVTDTILYENAVTQLDERLCVGIVELTRKAACEQVITKSLETAPPQVIADIKRRNNDVRAIAAFEALLADNPTDVSTLLELAGMHAEKGLREQEAGRSQIPEVEKALAYIDTAMELSPDNAAVYETAGYVYEILPDFSMATQQYTKAIALNPQSVEAYVGRGHTANLQGLLDIALNDFLKARSLDVHTQHPSVYTHLCRLQSTRHDLTAEAKTNCLTVLAIEHAGALNHAEAHQTLAKIALREGDTQAATNHYAEALMLTPDDGNLLTSLADYEISVEHYEDAERYARKAVSVTPTKAVARLPLAYALYQQQRFEEALDEALTGLSLIDADVSLLAPSKDKYRREFYYTLANIYHYTGNTEKEIHYKELGDQLAN